MAIFYIEPINRVNDKLFLKNGNTDPILHDVISDAIPGSPNDNTRYQADFYKYFGLDIVTETVYDYPYLSSSANHIFDLTTGYSKRGSSFSLSASTNIQNEQKQNMYYNMAQVLAGYRQYPTELSRDTKHYSGPVQRIPRECKGGQRGRRRGPQRCLRGAVCFWTTVL